jgi:hypothetical protein
MCACCCALHGVCCSPLLPPSSARCLAQVCILCACQTLSCTRAPPTSRGVATQVGRYTAHAKAMAQLAAHLLEGPVYEALRSRAQLGYTVDVRYVEHAAVVGFTIVVTGPLAVDGVLERAEEFVEGWVIDGLGKLGKRDFENAKEDADAGNVRLCSRSCPCAVESVYMWPCTRLRWWCRPVGDSDTSAATTPAP